MTKINKLEMLLLIGCLALFHNVSDAKSGDSAKKNKSPNESINANETIKLSPQAALDKLMEGNLRFSKDKSTCPERNSYRRMATFAKQKPFAIILGCSDSRVPPEIAFDQGIGDLFVVRIAGNVVGGTELDSIEYSALHNGSVIILVLGHENCGAVTAVMDNNTKDIEQIAVLIQPAVNKIKKEKSSLVEATESNVQNSVATIKQSVVIARLIQEGKINVVGAYYNLETGRVRLLPNE